MKMDHYYNKCWNRKRSNNLVALFDIKLLYLNYFSRKLEEKLYLLFREDRCIKIYNIATKINCTMTYLCTDVAVLCLISSISNLVLDQQHEDEQ